MTSSTMQHHLDWITLKQKVALCRCSYSKCVIRVSMSTVTVTETTESRIIVSIIIFCYFRKFIIGTGIINIRLGRGKRNDDMAIPPHIYIYICICSRHDCGTILVGVFLPPRQLARCSPPNMPYIPNYK